MCHADGPGVAGDVTGWIDRRDSELRAVEPSFIIHRVLRVGQADLLEVAEAGCLSAFFAGPVQRGEEHGGQNGDDRDRNEQFDQSEWSFFHL